MDLSKGVCAMPKAQINGIDIYYESCGEGTPLVWSHEFAGDCRSWKPQVNYFSRRYRVITYNARGYPPSDVPTDPDLYSQEQSIEDLLGLLDHLSIEKAHLGGLSMGGGVVLNFGLKYPHRARSLVVAGAGSGSDDPGAFRKRSRDMSNRMETEWASLASEFPKNPNRLLLMKKDPIGWQEHADAFKTHSNIGSALTMRSVQGKRPPIFSLEKQLKKLQVPTLIMVGDEDAACIEPATFLKRCIPQAGLTVFPRSGLLINLEEPALFNFMVLDFLTALDAGKWS